MVVVADNIRYVVDPSPFAVVELERHNDGAGWWTLLLDPATTRAENVFRLCHLELQISDAYDGTLPPFNDWLATVTEFYLVDGVDLNAADDELSDAPDDSAATLDEETRDKLWQMTKDAADEHDREIDDAFVAAV